MIILNRFLKGYDALKSYSLTAPFEDIKNPIDGVVYPLIAMVPDVFKQEVIQGISRLFGRPIQNPTVFMRQSPKGVHCPHRFHNDASMGNYSFMLYLNTLDGGTGLASHKETGEIRPTIDYDYSQDQNDPDKWDVYKTCEAVENRACIFDASLFHVALPIGGHGEGKEARTVLTVFFD